MSTPTVDPATGDARPNHPVASPDRPVVCVAESGAVYGGVLFAALMLWVFVIAFLLLGSVWLAVALVGFFVTLATGTLFALSRV